MAQQTNIAGRDFILGKVKPPREVVHVAEWGADVVIVGMTSKERDGFENAMMRQQQTGKKTTVTRDLTNFRGKLLAITLRDENDARLFSDGDADLLGNLPATIVEPLVEVASRLSGLTQADVESLTKNSESGPSEEPVSA